MFIRCQVRHRPAGRCSYQPHSTDEEAEAPRGDGSCPRSRANKWQSHRWAVLKAQMHPPSCPSPGTPALPRCPTTQTPNARPSPWLRQLQLSLHRSSPYTLCLPVPSALALRQAQNSAAAGGTVALCPLFPQENLKFSQERGPGSTLSGQGQRDQSNWLNCLA